MPHFLFDLQLFADEGGDAGGMAGAESTDTGIANGEADASMTGGQDAPVEQMESWDSIKGKYKKEYSRDVKAAVDKRFKNQQNLQSRIDAVDPLVQFLADKHGLRSADGSINIEALRAKVMDDDSAYEQEAFQRGMSVEDLKQLKTLERENAALKAANRRTEEAKEWDAVQAQADALKEYYPDFDFENELSNPEFGRMLATLQRAGFKDAMRTAYESIHREEIMSGALKYATQRTAAKMSNAIQAGMKRPVENGSGGQSSAGVGAIDPSSLTREQIAEISRRAARGERITF